MFDPVQFMLRMVYYYSRFLGVINFEIDLQTGRARVTRRASIYAALANVLVFGLLPLFTRSQLMQTLWSHAGLLHEYLYVIIHATRASCVLLTVLSRWWQRRQLIHLINAYSRLASRKPQVARLWRRRVIIKFITVLLTEFSQVAVSFITIRTILTLSQLFSILMLYVLTALVNVIISHFYFVTLNAHSHYILLNRELQAIFVETRCLEFEQRRAAHMIKCCSLADQLEDIARTQAEVQTLIESTARIFDIQSICITCTMYLSIIATIYFTFVGIYQTRNVGWSPMSILMIIEIICYFADVVVTMDNLYIVVDVHADMVRVLEQFSTCAPGLDERLEAVIESFQLQLRRNPLKMTLLKLYSVERLKVVAMASSLVTNSLVLVQYEFKNN